MATTNADLPSKIRILLNEKATEEDDESFENGNTNGQVSIAYKSERFLVVWMLLTRLPDDELHQVWEQYGVRLEAFALSYLLEDAEVYNGDNPEVHISSAVLYLQLVAQVVARIPELPTRLGAAILGRLEIVSNSASKVHYVLIDDVLSALGSWMTTDPHGAKESQAFERLWACYQQFFAASEETKRNDITNESRTATVFKSGKPSPDLQVMTQTIKSLLQGTQPDDTMNMSGDSDIIHMGMLRIFQSHWPQIMSDGNGRQLIKWITSGGESQISHDSGKWITFQQLPADIRFGWCEWVLSYVQIEMALRKNFRMQILKDPVLCGSLNQFLLAQVVSPVPDKSHRKESVLSLRATSWQAILSIVQSGGWDWMFRTSLPIKGSLATQPSLGKAASFCSWIGLASGEWRIQLQSAAVTFDETSNAIIYPQPTADCLAIATACAHLIKASVQFCVQVAENPQNSLLTSDALIHLRKSLQDALYTTVEYLTNFFQAMGPYQAQEFSHEERSDTDSSLQETGTSRLLELRDVSVAIFGSLLTEIDVWELQSEVVGEENSDKSEVTENILSCLSMVLPRVRAFDTMLPGVTAVLSSATENYSQESSGLTALLCPSILEFLQHFWRLSASKNDLVASFDEKDQDILIWACTSSEIWGSLHATSVQQRCDLASDILSWIDAFSKAMNGIEGESQGKDALSLVVGCCVMLLDGQKTPDKETRILSHAMTITNKR